MSLNDKQRLSEIAKIHCRENRRNQTNAEKIFWQATRRKSLEKFKIRRQHPIFFDFDGRETFYISDFICIQKKLIIEIDGIIHKQRTSEDKIRTHNLEELGYRVIRFSNDELENKLNSVIEKVKEYLIDKRD